MASNVQLSKRAGWCGVYGCGRPATWQITHVAEVVTVAGNSAGEESIALGHPAPDALILGARKQRVVIDWCCHQQDHIDSLKRLAEIMLDDIEVERYLP